jgi:hypothetical protein
MAVLSLAWKLARTALGSAPWWIWPMGALALLAGLQTIRYEHARTQLALEQAGFAEYQKRVAQATAAANARAIEDLQASQAWQNAALAARNARLQAANAKLQERLQEIADAPPDQDGPVAAVLRRSLERLWQ